MRFHRRLRIASQCALAVALAVGAAAQPVAAREWNSASAISFKYQPTVVPVTVPPWTLVSRTGAQCNSGTPQPIATDYASGFWLRGKHGGMAGNLPRVVQNSQVGTSNYVTADGTNVVTQYAGPRMAPGPANTCAITRFTVPAHQPAAASYTVTFLTIPSALGANGLGGGNGAAAFLVLNGVKVGPTINTAAPITTGSNHVQQTLTMSPGDTLDLALNPQGSPLGDITSTFFRIQGPEPIDPAPVALGSLPAVPTLGCSSGSVMPSVSLNTGTPQWYANRPSNAVNTAVTPTAHPLWDNVPGAAWIAPGGLPASYGTYKFITRVQVDACPSDPPAKLKLRFLSTSKSTVSVNGTMLPPYNGTTQAAGMTLYTHTFPVGTSGVQEVTFHVQSVPGPFTGNPALAANVLVTR